MTEYPYGYCGMPCALCSRNRTEGKSRCPGCSCDGYYTDVCRVHRCARERCVAHCGECEQYPCERLGKMGDFRDLNTNNVKRRTCDEIASLGLEHWRLGYAKRADMLSVALARYNNGRMKRFLCELFIQRDIGVLEEIMRRAEALTGSPGEIGKDFMLIAQTLLEEKSNQE